MCNRHVAHLIAEYEAARLVGGELKGEDIEEDEVESVPRETTKASAERSSLLAAIRSRFAR
jgi:hypothetical protein